MGYYDGGELPVYDHLARNYCVCDHWFSSVPGATWPNRLFSWIDPNFQEPTGYTHLSNDDHPPSDIRPGQELVLMIYRALISNQRAWERTLFVITYDEHGGLYDHVPPPMRPQDKAPFNRLGVRVPALILSPWATQGVCKQQFDHTSIIKTILTRFCQVDGKIPDMGLRTTEAADLGYALTASAARTRNAR
jgi:phospholipase C